MYDTQQATPYDRTELLKAAIAAADQAASFAGSSLASRQRACQEWTLVAETYRHLADSIGV